MTESLPPKHESPQQPSDPQGPSLIQDHPPTSEFDMLPPPPGAGNPPEPCCCAGKWGSKCRRRNCAPDRPELLEEVKQRLVQLREMEALLGGEATPSAAACRSAPAPASLARRSPGHLAQRGRFADWRLP